MKEEDVHLNLLSRYVSNEISIDEIETLLQWLSEDQGREEMLRDFQEAWDISKNYPEHFRVETPAAWVKIRNTIDEAGQQPVPAPQGKFIKIAALVLLLALIIIGAFSAFHYLKSLS